MSAEERDLPSSRKEAKSQGFPTYFTGKACSRGSFSMRNTSSGNCLCELCLEAARVTARAWKSANRASLLEARRANYAINKAGVLAKQRDWRISHHAAALAGQARYRAANRADIRKRARDRAKQCPLPGKFQTDKRRAAKLQRIPCWFGEFDIFVATEANDIASRRSEATGIAWHVDHMIPLRSKLACGLHCGHNLQVIPAHLNQKKHNKIWLSEPDQWIRELKAERA